MKKKSLVWIIPIIAIALLIVLIAVFGSIIFIVSVFKSSQANIQNPGMQTKVELVKEFFPELDGIERVCWEMDLRTKDNSRVPGPTDTRYIGFIVLEEDVAEKYAEEYEWKNVDVVVSATYIDVSDYQDDTWYYSATFNKDVMSDTMMGKVYFNGNIMWFDVTEF